LHTYTAPYVVLGERSFKTIDAASVVFQTVD